MTNSITADVNQEIKCLLVVAPQSDCNWAGNSSNAEICPSSGVKDYNEVCRLIGSSC